MTHPREPDPLRPMLNTTESQLVERLEEACGHDVRGESTAELMRLEETLSDAARAAKQAVSLRRRLRTGHGGTDLRHQADVEESSSRDQARAVVGDPGIAQVDDLVAHDGSAADAEADLPADADDAIREFLDHRGLPWRVWAVTQEQLHMERLIANGMGDYRDGWLTFECMSGSERRRLPHYPPNWRRLPNLDLEALLDRAESVRLRRESGEDSATSPS